MRVESRIQVYKVYIRHTWCTTRLWFEVCGAEVIQINTVRRSQINQSQLSIDLFMKDSDTVSSLDEYKHLLDMYKW